MWGVSYQGKMIMSRLQLILWFPAVRSFLVTALKCGLKHCKHYFPGKIEGFVNAPDTL